MHGNPSDIVMAHAFQQTPRTWWQKLRAYFGYAS
jgi:hypothetical protein